MLDIVFWCVVSYLSGSVLYSQLISTYVLNTDITTIGDGNPGTTNVAKVGGAGWAIMAFLLDCIKAAIPVGVAYYIVGIQDWRILLIGLAPGLGHAYPLWFKFRGGKAIAAMGGAWVGIALLEVIVVGATLLVFWTLSLRVSAWATIFMLLSTQIYLLLTNAPSIWVAFMFATILFLTWTHRRDLNQPPGVKPWVKRVVMLWH